MVSAKLIRDMDQKPKGFGYVEFKTLDGLKDALGRSGGQMLGRTVRTSVAEPREWLVLVRCFQPISQCKLMKFNLVIRQPRKADVVVSNEALLASERPQWLKKLLNGDELDHSLLDLLPLDDETFHPLEDSRGKIVDSPVEPVAVMLWIVIGEVFADRNSLQVVQVLHLNDHSVLVSVQDHLEVISVVQKGNSVMDRVWRSCRMIGGRVGQLGQHRHRLLVRRWVVRDQGGMEWVHQEVVDS